MVGTLGCLGKEDRKREGQNYEPMMQNPSPRGDERPGQDQMKPLHTHPHSSPDPSQKPCGLAAFKDLLSPKPK